MQANVTAPMESINHVDPVVTAIILCLFAFAAIVLMFIFLPRIDDLMKTRAERDKYKAERDYYINALSIELIKSGHTASEVRDIMTECKKKITEKEHRAKQASKRSKIFASIADKLRGEVNV